MSRPVIGFIGLGLMGQGFVKRLLSTSHKVVALDVVPDKVAAAAEVGAEIADTPAELAQKVDIVEICVTTPANVVEIVEGANGLITAAAQPGTR